MNNNRQKGRKAEIIAKEYLVLQGYKVIATNYQTSIGEIDIIGLKDDYLIFVEVKSLQKIKELRPYQSVNATKQKKIKQVAQQFLQGHAINYQQIRFDVIEIELSTKAITHWQQAFE